MMFYQIIGVESLCEISDGLFSSLGKLHHVRAQAIARSTLSYANKHRDYRVYQEFYYRLQSISIRYLKEVESNEFVRIKMYSVWIQPRSAFV